MHVYMCGLFHKQTKAIVANWSHGCAPTKQIGVRVLASDLIISLIGSYLLSRISFFSSTKFPTIYLDYATMMIGLSQLEMLAATAYTGHTSCTYRIWAYQS
jgi:hypothetical protein